MQIRTISTAVFTLLLMMTTGAAAREASAPDSDHVLVVRTVEDVSVSPLPAGCPFVAPNVRLGALVWAVQPRASDGEIVNRDVRLLGTASACGKITTALVPFAQVPFYLELSLPDGLFAAQGFCAVTSNNVPQPGLILAGCTLAISAAPAGVAGGNMTSNSVFNPLHLPGFDTGSIWTLRLYPSE